MFNLRLCNAATVQYSQLKFGRMHLCGMDYKYFSPHCCKCNSFGCTAAIRCGNACHGPHGDSLYSGSEHSQFNSLRLVKRETGFPTHGGRWLTQTNYDALMTHHTTENTYITLSSDSEQLHMDRYCYTHITLSSDSEQLHMDRYCYTYITTIIGLRTVTHGWILLYIHYTIIGLRKFTHG